MLNRFNIKLIFPFKNTLEPFYSDYQNHYPEMFNFTSIFILIVFFDQTLKLLFGSTSRWFQLHTMVNSIVSVRILDDVKNIIINPHIGYNELQNNDISYYILALHIYHIIFFKKLGFFDYFHHILFVGLGIVPSILYVKSNQIYMGYIACNGVPGIIEYITLSLYKHKKISLYMQKKITSNMYIYIRLPLCIVGVVYNYIGYTMKYYNDNLYITLYINLLLYLNGTFFTELTLDSFGKVKYKNKAIKSE